MFTAQTRDKSEANQKPRTYVTSLYNYKWLHNACEFLPKGTVKDIINTDRVIVRAGSLAT